MESGYKPYHWTGLSYNEARDIVPKRRREWEGLVVPHLEKKKPNQHFVKSGNYQDMIYTDDSQCMQSPYRTQRFDYQIPETNKGSKPNAPKNVAAKALSIYSIVVSWSRVTTATYYSIYRDGRLIFQTSSLSYLDMGLESDTKYTYTITATSFWGESEKSGAASATTTTTTGVDVTIKTSLPVDATGNENYMGMFVPGGYYIRQIQYIDTRSVETDSGSVAISNDDNVVVWLRLVLGSAAAGFYYSLNGTDWTTIASGVASITEPFYVTIIGLSSTVSSYIDDFVISIPTAGSSYSDSFTGSDGDPADSTKWFIDNAFTGISSNTLSLVNAFGNITNKYSFAAS
jgi:hypothetical protein